MSGRAEAAMTYFYEGALPLDDARLSYRIDRAASQLHQKLASLDPGRIGISPYNQRYLREKLQRPLATLQLYSHLLSLALDGLRDARAVSDLVLVDYGGGSGVLSLLAKSLGIGRVIYNDIYDVSCEDAARLGKALGLPADDYICGDLDVLVETLRSRDVAVDVLCSYDVIEHIYDIEAYLRGLGAVPSAGLRLVLGSGANGRNPLIWWRLTRTHRNVERRDRSESWGRKERDSSQSFRRLRAEIISGYDGSIGVKEANRLARRTRGLMRADIERCVDEYKATGRVTYRSAHPTNTCDPHTGNWAEHIMRPEWLGRILEEEGFRVRILRGYWSSSPSGYKRLAKRVLNRGISRLGHWGLPLAPYYVIQGDRTGELTAGIVGCG